MISVIVPVYNVEKYIEKCVESIIAQTYTDLEIILVDDGSTDNSGKLCDLYASKDERIRVIHKENGGLSDARNVGIEQSTGEYLSFIDSDDYIHPQMMEILYRNMQEYGADLSMCDSLEVAENEEFVFEKICNRVRVVEHPLEELRNNAAKISVAWNKLYPRKMFDEVKYPKGKLHEDEYVIHELLYISKKMIVTDEKLYAYVQRQDSITSKINIKRIEDKLSAYICRIVFFEGKGNKNMQKYAYDMMLLYIYGLLDGLATLQKEEKAKIKKVIRRKLIIATKNTMKLLTLKEKSKACVFYMFPFGWMKYKSEQR